MVECLSISTNTRTWFCTPVVDPFVMLSFAACILIVLLSLAALYPIIKYLAHVLTVRFAIRRVPGPSTSSLLWGEEWKLFKDIPGVHQHNWHNQYGRILKFSGAFGHQIISITDPRAISFILGEAAYAFPKPDGVRAWFKALLGEGILWVEGKEFHETHRRTLAPALSQQSVRNLTPVFYETSSRLAAQWGRILDQSPFDDVEIEVTAWAGRFALDTIGLSAFSYNFDCLSGAPNGLADALDALTNVDNRPSSFYMRALFWICPSILSIGQKGRLIKQTKLELGDIARKMWLDAKAGGDPEGKTVMSTMLRIGATSGGLDEEYIVSQMRTVISAAYETVSAIIAWTLYELASRPKLQQCLREEVSVPGEPSFEDLNTRFPFLDAVVKETLRLHPAILENHHVAAETIGIPLSEPLPGTSLTQLVIPKGTILSIPVNVVQTEPSVWGNDAHFFRPERWLNRTQEKSRTRREIFAFSEGPRGCIGKQFAITEIKALLVTLLRQYSFSNPYEIEAFQSFVIRPRIKGQSSSSLPLLVRRV
ncbi:hypothetical protein HGRIS_007450 [Hohenbuehelia grisea]|uniref:Cytochrome P450 n=1 Tax=Hohenbuehelia grisea TaxID=104357 RepID=A0ABR3J6A0_9AGAR